MFSIQRFSPVLWTLHGCASSRSTPATSRPTWSNSSTAEPAGRVADIGGPAVYAHADLARMYLAARDSRRRVVQLPVPGGSSRASVRRQPGAGKPIGTIGFDRVSGRTK